MLLPFAVSGLAPLISNTNKLPNQYIVVLRKNIEMPSTIYKRHSHRKFSIGSVHGYSAALDESELHQVRQHPNVEYVEEDILMRINDQQDDAPWGLSRISHVEKPDEAHYHEYVYPKNAGLNVTVYVVDTGCNAEHSEFEGRAIAAVDFTEDEDSVDGNGHGTHVSGTIAGKTYGIAKSANIVCVKVLSAKGSGSNSGVIQGIEWVIKHHKSRGKGAKSAANMSLGGGRSKTLDKVVDAAVDAGVHFVVAAGNDDADACNYSPAASEKAITVGATTIADRLAWFSNHGKCVNILAPGKDILSSWIGSVTATNTISGTSMASPHVAGLAAVYLGGSKTAFTGKELMDLFIKWSVKDVIAGLPNPDEGDDPDWPFPWPPRGKGGKTPNRLAYHPAENVEKKPYNYKSTHYDTAITKMKMILSLFQQLMA
jgi:cerevisin